MYAPHLLYLNLLDIADFHFFMDGDPSSVNMMTISKLFKYVLKMNLLCVNVKLCKRKLNTSVCMHS